MKMKKTMSKSDLPALA